MTREIVNNSVLWISTFKEVPLKNVRVKEAAEYLGLSKSLLDKLRMGSEGPSFFKLGRAVIYSTADLDAWLSSRRVIAANDNNRRAA